MMRKMWLPLLIMVTAGGFVSMAEVSAIDAGDELERLKSGEVRLDFPEKVGIWPNEPAPATKYTWDNIKARKVDGVKIIYYKTAVWGTVKADFTDFRAKVNESLNDKRGWSRANLRFVEVKSGYDLTVVLSDGPHLDFPGCSSALSCTDSNRNYVIINDERWRTGTEASRANNMSQRDYQHMVVNHEMGHWLGHHAHATGCSNGGLAPLMLQQSTGLRGCSSMNAWPLKEELWVKV